MQCDMASMFMNVYSCKSEVYIYDRLLVLSLLVCLVFSVTLLPRSVLSVWVVLLYDVNDPVAVTTCLY